MKILTVIGARPQFVKAAMVSRAINSFRNSDGPNARLHEIIVHTGQHYDYNMSRLFFEELSIPVPDYHLEVGSGNHGAMTGSILCKVEEVLLGERPDVVLVYGDTNSTLAGALAASKLHIPVAHVEAGLRSFNKRMPEEINRLLTDHISEILYAPTDAAVHNLHKEGISNGVEKVGDVMLDAYLAHKALAGAEPSVLAQLQLIPKHYSLATVHRQENTDNPQRLEAIFEAFKTIGKDEFPLIVPLHPRTRKMMAQHGISTGKGVRLIDPIGYLDMINLEVNARVIFTDSGGVQKEAYFAGVPCVTLRDETEWVETVEAGVNLLAGAQRDSILGCHEKALHVNVNLKPGLYGNGQTAQAIVKSLLTHKGRI
jgi:UDP-N-acetylglucosamine 2-epimerase